MIKKISYIIYLILKFFNKIFIFFFNKDFLLWFYTFIQNDSYISIIIKKKKINFFCPNHLIKFRINTLFTKEPETINWINSFKKNKNKKIIFWDIGANIGLYSIYSSVFHGNKIKVISFEPSMNNLRILSRNISVNYLYKNIFINQIPLGNVNNDYCNFNDSNFIEGSAFNYLYTSKKLKKKKYNNNYKVFSSSIDNIIDMKKNDFPNYIKIDVDGNENIILKGGIKLLKKSSIKEILIEIDEKDKKKTNEIIKLLTKNYFKIKSINKSKLFKSNNIYVKNYIFENINL